jgi:hypothetical protein
MCAEVEEMKAALMVGFLSVADSIVRCCCSCQDLNGSIAKLPELPGGGVSQQWVPDSSLQMLSPSALFIPTRIALRRTGPRYRYRHRSCCEIWYVCRVLSLAWSLWPDRIEHHAGLPLATTGHACLPLPSPVLLGFCFLLCFVELCA